MCIRIHEYFFYIIEAKSPCMDVPSRNGLLLLNFRHTTMYVKYYLSQESTTKLL